MCSPYFFLSEHFLCCYLPVLEYHKERACCEVVLFFSARTLITSPLTPITYSFNTFRLDAMLFSKLPCYPSLGWATCAKILGFHFTYKYLAVGESQCMKTNHLRSFFFPGLTSNSWAQMPSCLIFRLSCASLCLAEASIFISTRASTGSIIIYCVYERMKQC